MTEVLPLVHVERHALIADLQTLDEHQWPLVSLLLAVSGRSAARADLAGPGLPLLG